MNITPDERAVLKRLADHVFSGRQTSAYERQECRRLMDALLALSEAVYRAVENGVLCEKRVALWANLDRHDKSEPAAPYRAKEAK